MRDKDAVLAELTARLQESSERASVRSQQYATVREQQSRGPHLTLPGRLRRLSAGAVRQVARSLEGTAIMLDGAPVPTSARATSENVVFSPSTVDEKRPVPHDAAC